ncbi:MAG: XdhC family protein [Gemmatimonadetes bacterium]|nr:XdhC family protein [Gemmatimonadota bacterium]
MKHWLETRAVLDRLSEARRAGSRAALATIVRVKGSAYRHEGAKLLVVEDGRTAGNVSGGCLEQDVREVALQVIRSGHSEVRNYCSGSDEIAAWDLGMGCDGQVDLLIEPVLEDRSEVRARLDQRAPFAVCTALPAAALSRAPEAGRRLLVDAISAAGDLGSRDLNAQATARAREFLGEERSGITELGDRSVFIESLMPPPQLVLFGAGDDARPLAQFASDVGFRVIVVDKRPAYLTVERFPAAAALVDSRADALERRLTLDPTCYTVVMTHSFFDDQAFVRLLLPSAVSYIGMLGPRQRTERILQILGRERPLDPSQRDRIYGPVGLDIGTDGAEQVALSVLSEILSVRSGRRARSLRDREVPIHADDE